MTYDVANLVTDLPPLPAGHDRIMSLIVMDRPSGHPADPRVSVEAGIETRQYLEAMADRFGVTSPDDVHLRSVYIDVSVDVSEVFGADSLSELPTPES